MQHLDLSDRKNMFYWQTNRKITAKQQKEVFLDRNQSVKKEEAKAAIEYGMIQAGKKKSEVKVIELSDPIEFGSVNSVLKATLADGTKIVIRIHPHFVKNGYFWAEKVATSEAKRMGVPTFDTYFIDDSQTKFSFAFMIMEALPGKTLQEFTRTGSMEHEKKLIKETGKYVALIHQVHPKGFGFFDNQKAKLDGILQGQYEQFKDHIYAALDEDLSFLIEYHVLTKDQSLMIQRIFDKNQPLMNCKKPSLIHNDIADWNLLSDGKHITGIIDWDECFAGDPVMDFSAYSLFFGEPRMSWFKEGYEEISKLPKQFEEKFQLFKLRYLISKMHLRKKRLLVYNSEGLQQKLERGLQAMKEVFTYFGVH